MGGAEKIAANVEKAKTIYTIHKEQLEAEMSMEKFSELYSKITEFSPLEDEFYEIMDTEAENIKGYIQKHITEFAKIV